LLKAADSTHVMPARVTCNTVHILWIIPDSLQSWHLAFPHCHLRWAHQLGNVHYSKLELKSTQLQLCTKSVAPALKCCVNFKVFVHFIRSSD